MRVASRESNYVSKIYNTFIYAYMPHIHMLQLIEILQSVTKGPYQIYLTFGINILQDLHGQSSHFQVLMRYLKRARSISTCHLSWLARYGIASSPYFNEQGFYFWKM